jgi:prepilin peptidase CpaA
MTEAIRYLAFLIFPLGMAFAAASDLFTMTISNWLTMAMVAAFLFAALLLGMDLHTFVIHLAAGGGILALGFFCFAFGWIGGGDAKFAAIIALWFGAEGSVEFLGLASVLGGGLTLLVLSFRATALPAFIVRQPWIQRLHDRRQGVPYGIALAAAALVVYPHTQWMTMAG